MWSREDFDKDERVVKAHFLIEGSEWDRLEYNINVSKSQFLRDYIRRINAMETDLDILYKRMVEKRKELHMVELEIEELKARIEELERANVKRVFDTV